MISIYRMATVRFGSVRFHGTEPEVCSVRFLNGSVLTGSGSVLARPVRFQYGSVHKRFGSCKFRFGFDQVGSVPLRFGCCNGSVSCRVGSVSWNQTFMFGSVPIISTVRFHSVSVRFHGTELYTFSVRFHYYGSVQFNRFVRFVRFIKPVQIWCFCFTRFNYEFSTG